MDLSLQFGLATLLAPTLVAITILVGLLIALHGSQPSERPEIIRALAELFRRRCSCSLYRRHLTSADPIPPTDP